MPSDMAITVDFYRHLRSRKRSMARLLGTFVRSESPSFDKDAVNRLGRLIAGEWRRRGAFVQTFSHRTRSAGETARGNHIRAELRPMRGKAMHARQILVLGHLDTVYELGTLARMPFRIQGGRAFGPGTLDMKSGLVIALCAADALARARVSPRRPVVFLWTSDEEIGSGTSRVLIEREARRSAAVLVLEPASGLDGRLKTSRKGVGQIELVVTGRAAHAGINPQDGVNAVHELAAQIAKIVKFNDPRRGITVNVDVVKAGSRSNVIASHAHAQIDVRVARRADARLLENKFRALRPIDHRARIIFHGGINRPPLERSLGVVALFRQAHMLAQEMRLDLQESATGGGSDGNFTAALGVPTLDGLGGVGHGAHTPGEYVLLKSLPERAALLAALLATL